MRRIFSISIIMTINLFIITIKATQQTDIIRSATDASTISKQGNNSMRNGKRIQFDSTFFEPKPRVHIIKIPSHIQTVKLIRPYQEQFSKNIFDRKRPLAAKQNTNTESQTYENYDYYIRDFKNLNSKKVKRNLKNQRIKDIGPENYYENNNFAYNLNILGERPEEAKRYKITRKVIKSKKKIPSDVYAFTTKHDKGDINKIKYSTEEFKTPNVHKSEDDSEEYYDFESSATTQYAQRNPPSRFQKIITTSPGKAIKSNYFKETPVLTKYGNDYFPEMEFKNWHSKKEPFFHQHYTSHNPLVTTNFGLPNVTNTFQYSSKVSNTDNFEKLGRQSMSGSEQILTAIPASNPGIQVIQPPQFRDVNFNRPTHPSRSLSSTYQSTESSPSQKATIRDILDQDCPNYEIIGFCESPPRYPMHQIKNIIKKCAIILEAMNTQNIEDQKTVIGFSKRSGFYDETENGTSPIEPKNEHLVSQKKISSEGGAACHSDIFLMEPGYAREMISGKWFVVVQDPDVLQQKIVTDTCSSSGKSCAGLINLNCNKNAFKSTKCIQRYSYQKLISWDPDSPDSCPKMRVFKFPSACVCHLGP